MISRRSRSASLKRPSMLTWTTLIFVSAEKSSVLSYPEDAGHGLEVTPIEQGMFMRASPGVFEPCAGSWGRRGANSVRLKPPEAHRTPRTPRRLASRRSQVFHHYMQAR